MVWQRFRYTKSSANNMGNEVKHSIDKELPNLFFIHMGKTAGISLEHVLRQNYPASETCEYYYDSDFIGHAGEPLDYKLFFGHNWYYTIQVLPEGTIPTTVLRDPIQRSFSAYEHMFRDESHYYHKTIIENFKSPKDFLDSEHISRTFSNAQTRILGSEYDLKELLGRVISGKVSKQEATLEMRKFRLNTQANETMLETAKNRLKNMPVFGLTEQFDESIRRIASIIGLSVDSIPHKNSAPKESQSRESRYSTEDIDALKRLNELDLELYEFAATIFQERGSDISK